MSRGLRIAPAATRDIVDAYNWYEDRQPGLGERFRTELHVAFVLVQQFSEAESTVHRDLWRLLRDPRGPSGVDMTAPELCAASHVYPATGSAVLHATLKSMRRYNAIGVRGGALELVVA